MSANLFWEKHSNILDFFGSYSVGPLMEGSSFATTLVGQGIDKGEEYVNRQFSH